MENKYTICVSAVYQWETGLFSREGYTLLNKPDNRLKNAHCVPSGLMFLVQWQSGVSEYFYLHLAEYRGDPEVESVVHCFITRSERVVCFEAQAFFMLIIDAGMVNGFNSKFSKNMFFYFSFEPLKPFLMYCSPKTRRDGTF